MSIEHFDPDTELRTIEFVTVEQEADERGRFMAAAFSEEGHLVLLAMNAN